jgi:hypothetical protein
MTCNHGDPAAESFEGPFLRIARRHSLCEDDAWEALGRGFEIALRHRHRIRRETATAWFATVVLEEATTAAARTRPRPALPDGDRSPVALAGDSDSAAGGRSAVITAAQMHGYQQRARRCCIVANGGATRAPIARRSTLELARRGRPRGSAPLTLASQAMR